MLSAISLKLHSQNKTSFNSSDSFKTVAIYSSTKSFFKDYSIDTLVFQLNTLNTNRKIKYNRNTEDRSKTGFYADYLIDLMVWMKTPQFIPGTMERTYEMQRVEVPVQQADGSWTHETQYINTEVYRDVKSTTERGEGMIRIKITEKNKNKTIRHTLNQTNVFAQSLKLTLIIQLIEYLLEYFSK